MDCLRRPRPPVSVVNSIIVAITMCVNAPTLAYYGPGYYGHNYNPLPYPYTLRSPIILPPLLDPQKTSPPFEKLLSQQATQIYLPPHVYRGFAYQTAYGDGGGTKVVFVRGPDANALLEESIRSISFPHVLPLSVTATSDVLKITQNNTTKTEEKSQKTQTTAQNNKTASDAKLEEKAENEEAMISVILPPSHSLVTPGALYYSVPPGYVNSLPPAIPYFAQPFFYPPTDFFGRFGLPSLFSALDATAENAEISSNSSASVPNSSGDEASSQPADTQTVSSSSSDNGASTGEEDSSSSEEASTESNTSGESSSSEASVSGSMSESSETSSSSEENSSTSETASDPEKNKDSVPSSDNSAESSTNTISANDSLPTGASIGSDTNSNDVPTKVDTGSK